MDNFFDVRDFLITILRKTKMIIIVIFICALLGGCIRFLPLMKEYINFKEPVAENIELTMDEFPYIYRATKVVYISEVENGEERMENKPVVNAYLEWFGSEEVEGILKDEFFPQAMAEQQSLNQKLLKYNYITSSMAEAVYSLGDFYASFCVEKVVDNYVRVYVKTGNKELSNAMLERFSQLLHAYIGKEMGEYGYLEADCVTVNLLPEPQNGLAPKAFESDTKEVVTRVSIKTIIVESVKGAVWGVIAGVILSLAIAFFFNCTSTKLTSEKELENFNNKVIMSVSTKKKRGIFGIIPSLIDKLEGNAQPVTSYTECAKVIHEYIEAEDGDRDHSILFIGTVRQDKMDRIKEEYTSLLHERNITAQVDTAVQALTSSEDILKLKAAKRIIIMEEIGYSNKREIIRQNEQLKYFGKDAIGCVVFK